MPGGSPDAKADMAYADDTAAVGDATAVMGSVAATGARGADGRFSAGISCQGAAILSMSTERVGQSS